MGALISTNVGDESSVETGFGESLLVELIESLAVESVLQARGKRWSAIFLGAA